MSFSSHYLPHIANIRNQFFLKRLNKRRPSTTSRGRLNIAYVFVDSSEEFEHIESPHETGAQATPTQPPNEGAMNQEGSGSVGSEEAPLPSGWEERQVSSHSYAFPLSLSLSLSLFLSLSESHVALSVGSSRQFFEMPYCVLYL